MTGPMKALDRVSELVVTMPVDMNAAPTDEVYRPGVLIINVPVPPMPRTPDTVGATQEPVDAAAVLICAATTRLLRATRELI